MLQSGELAQTDLIWREGMAEWTAAHKVPEVNPATSPPAAAPGVGQTPTQGPIPGAVAPVAPVAHAHVPNYLVHCILVTVLCCQIFGIIGIVFAAQVDGKVSRGDIAGAIAASNQAKLWAWLGFGGGLLFYVLIFFMALAGGLSGV